jgi:hypothetical protein
LIPEDSKTIQNIKFYQKRYVKDCYIYKDIQFSYKDENYSFQERVKALTLEDFELLFEQAEVHLLDIFGDYKLRKFDKNSSERLVMIFK